MIEVDHGDGGADKPTLTSGGHGTLGTGSLVPAWLSLVSLPFVFVAVQLGASILSQVSQSLLLTAGLPPQSARSGSTLVAMATGSLLLLLSALLIPLTRSVSLRSALGLRPVAPSQLLWASLGTVALSPLADWLMSLMAEIFPEGTLGSVPALNALARTSALPLIWPVFALLPGLAEEAFFRGLLLRSFRKPTTAVVVSALCFAAFHLDPHHVAGVLPLGLFLSWVGYRHGLLATAVAHVVNNTLAVLTVRVSALDVGYGTKSPMPGWWIWLGLAVAGVAVSQLRMESGEPQRS